MLWPCFSLQWSNPIRTTLWRTWGYSSPFPNWTTTLSPTILTAWTERWGLYIQVICLLTLVSLNCTSHNLILFHALFTLQDHSHTPWVIIVAKHLEQWLSEVQRQDSWNILNNWYVCLIKKMYFVFVAQQSATEKLQGEGGLQTVYSGRYLKRWIAFAFKFSDLTVWRGFIWDVCSFRDPEERPRCPRRRRELWRSHQECQYCFESHQGAWSQIFNACHLFQTQTVFYSLTVQLWETPLVTLLVFLRFLVLSKTSSIVRRVTTSHHRFLLAI